MKPMNTVWQNAELLNMEAGDRYIYLYALKEEIRFQLMKWFSFDFWLRSCV
jgi:hypothetical protein